MFKRPTSGPVLTAIVVLVFGFLSLMGFASASGAAEQGNSGISVTGVGRVAVVPDTAEVVLGVVTQGATAVQAMEENNRRIQAVIEKLKAEGLDEAALQTGELGLYPEYEQPGYPGVPEKGQVPRIVAYRAVNSLRVKVNPVEKAGTIIDTALAAGANQVYGLRFMASGSADLELQALTLAVEDARRKAETVARALGVKLGVPQNVVVNTSYPYQPLYSGAKLDAAAQVPLQPGQVEITATVYVVYAISP